MTTYTDAILVLGATGKVGRRLVPVLQAAGRRVKAASRSGAVRFDWTEQDTWAGALEGVSAVQLLAPQDPALAEPFVRQAVDAGVRRFVALSGRGMDRVPSDAFRGMAAAEKAVQGSGVEWTVLRPNSFNQNFDEAEWRAPLRAGRLALPVGDVPEPFVDVRDIAEVTAALLTSDALQGEVYDLSGATAPTYAEAVEVIARAAERPIVYEELTPEEYRAELLDEGYPEEAVHDLDALFAVMRDGGSAAPVDTVARILGREPVPFAEYAAKAAASGAWS
ncbi:NAD(P)H-binding protein [Streptomyces roseirectus]|uniref:NAD(P)H-binding protein n=1 Tax=Streptomyces roseirectus TaxID=2768066 RepID=A0A7H0IP79_9ACTN|nr:NAD(P)H-binding protein [Streptomyces roseirectus]QNP74595.1 NAD(P)H-binding protein [Streptomyces roseirectus]